MRFLSILKFFLSGSGKGEKNSSQIRISLSKPSTSGLPSPLSSCFLMSISAEREEQRRRPQRRKQVKTLVFFSSDLNKRFSMEQIVDGQTDDHEFVRARKIHSTSFFFLDYIHLKIIFNKN